VFSFAPKAAALRRGAAPSYLIPGTRRVATGAALFVALAGSAAIAAGAEAETAPPAHLEEIEVVATGLFPGIGVAAGLVPTHVQRIDGDTISRQHQHDMGEVLNSSATSVNVNDTEGNPFQRDVTFRGFAASPILGTPQGISVFVDGVRVNEAFGDTVSWDLIAPATIAEVNIVPGSNPVYGLNTLAGAITVRTKRGTNHRGAIVECEAGSFGRRACSAQGGGVSNGLDYFASVDGYRDHGWGAQNGSQLAHYFGQLGWRRDNSDLALSVTAGHSDLHGNQTIPLQFLTDPTQPYTYPDRSINDLLAANIMGRMLVTERWTAAGSVHYRRLLTSSVNSNVNGEFDPGLYVSPSNAPTSNALNNVAQYRPGASGQLSQNSTVLGLANELTLGGEWERGSTDFNQALQAAGFSRNTSSAEAATLQARLHALNELGGLYVSDTLSLTERTALTLATRYSRAHVKLTDEIGTANNGDDVYARWLPAGGISVKLAPQLRAYANYGEAMRVPSPVESTCADPSAPCQLPNAFVSDPPLRAVRAQSFEAGLEGTIGRHWQWNAAVFRTTLLDDIQFIGTGTGALNSGYFQNIGSTRRQGLEFGLTGREGRFSLSAHYGYTDATFRSDVRLYSPTNTSATSETLDCASGNPCVISPDPYANTISVQAGDHIPGVPRHSARLRLDFDWRPDLSFGAEIIGQSSQFVRGDENNRDSRGPVPGFSIVNFDLHYTPRPHLSVFARVSNVFDRRYSTFGVLGTNFFAGTNGSYVTPVPVKLPPVEIPVSSTPGNATGPSADSSGGSVITGVSDVAIGTPQPTQFRSVGPPRGMWLGVTYSFGGA
jgi:iron complex outermembrane recepter protein